MHQETPHEAKMDSPLGLYAQGLALLLSAIASETRNIAEIWKKDFSYMQASADAIAREINTLVEVSETDINTTQVKLLSERIQHLPTHFPDLSLIYNIEESLHILADTVKIDFEYNAPIWSKLGAVLYQRNAREFSSTATFSSSAPVEHGEDNAQVHHASTLAACRT
ncbi:MAG: hypothetical protein OEW08_09740 [Gammaproteobacteria bacterium]|nr:hypothetical protein [Gammaproteobacteria bacterium]